MFSFDTGDFQLLSASCLNTHMNYYRWKQAYNETSLLVPTLCLAAWPHSWMKILWQYARKLKVSILLVDIESVTLTRVGDMAWTDKLAYMGFKGASLVGMNRVRKFKQVHPLAL